MARSKAASASPISARSATDFAPPRSLLWLQGLLCGGLVTLAMPTALLLAVLFGPAVVAAVLDRQPGRPIARCVALVSLSAITGPITLLWAGGQTMAAALVLATDPDAVGWAWGAAAAGWLLAELLPVGVRILVEVASRSRATALAAARKRLEVEWGFSPAANPNPK